jgi:D-tyrosyl-tRNA(Tyr) deacylase
MRVLIQRVKRASVNVDGHNAAETGKGLLIFVGIGRDDNVEDIERMVKKVINLRIFEDEYGKMNLNIKQVEGDILSVSQFTLYADTRKGNRPGFDQAADPGMAKGHWESFNNLLRENNVDVREGVFGARMEVELINDGPVTIWLDSKNRS